MVESEFNSGFIPMKFVSLLSLLLPLDSYQTNRPRISAELTAEGHTFNAIETSSLRTLGGITPFYADKLLGDWERVLGLVVSPDSSYQQRQQRVLAKLSETGGLSIPYFTRLAANLGYEITIDEPQPFRAGINRAGQRLYVDDIPWVWVVNVKNSNTMIYHFRAGSSASGEGLMSFSEQRIESLFNDLKPAHTFCYFTYEEDV